MKTLEYLIDKAKAAGADQVDGILVESSSLSVSFRQGELEDLGRAEGSEVGLRVLIGKKQAVTSTSDLSKSSLDKLVERATDMVKVVPEDPYVEIATQNQFAKNQTQESKVDKAEVPSQELIRRAKEAEDAALSVKGVNQSEGASAGWGWSDYTIMTSEGFSGHHSMCQHSLSCMALAGTGESMERDYESTAATTAEGLENPTHLGRKTGERAVKKLNPRKVKTGQYPILCDRRLGGYHLLNPLVNAINGMNVARGTSFLCDALNQPLFGPNITIYDDPHLSNGLGSRLFDREGIPCSKLPVVEKGELKAWLLNLHAANQLGMKSTGHAFGGISAPPSIGVSNFYLTPSTRTLKDLFIDAHTGFYVTELMGFGINNVTGDYSMGASGFWIENGEISFPVSEVTIAGNLKEMYRTLVPANDLIMDAPVSAPTVLIESMMVAGL